MERERIDDLGINGYQIIQKEQGFCFGMDAVLLSDFAQVKNGGRVLDLGTGTGILPILMEAKTKAVHLTGLEIQPEMAEMAARSVKLNHLEDKIEIVEGDIKEASAIFSHDSFDTITSNPPYMIGQHGLKNPSETKAIARHEILCTFAAAANVDVVPCRIYYDTPDGKMKLFCKVRVIFGEPMPAAQFAMEGRRDIKKLRENKQAILDAWSEL